MLVNYYQNTFYDQKLCAIFISATPHGSSFANLDLSEVGTRYNVFYSTILEYNVWCKHICIVRQQPLLGNKLLDLHLHHVISSDENFHWVK